VGEGGAGVGEGGAGVGEGGAGVGAGGGVGAGCDTSDMFVPPKRIGVASAGEAIGPPSG
jgi:hypothetical protein